ncbi:MAG: hypothetical protein AMXMBFR33_25230 [Candidatus Xenobia bacterium]
MSRVSPRNLQLLSLQLGVLLRSGVRLLDALKVAGAGEDPRLSEAMGRVRERVAGGAALSQAMKAEPHVFPPMYVHLVALSEQIGAMALIFDRLAEHLSHQGTLRRQLLASLLYPSCVLGLSLVLVGLLKFWMLPSFLVLVRQLGAPLPWLTRAVSLDLPGTVWLIVLLVALGVGEALFLTWRHPEGRQKMEDAAYAVPGLGKGAYMAIWCRLSRDLAVMLSSGISLLRSLTLLSEQPTGSRRVDQILQDTLKGLRLGKSLTETLGSDPAVPGMLRHLVAAGEVSGRLPALLARFADVQEEALQLELETALKLVEPLLLGVLGLGVGVVLLAAFLPVYHMMLAL